MRKVADGGAVALLVRGYYWFVSNLRCAITKLRTTRLSKSEREMFSDGLYAIGDLHFCQGALNAALRAYLDAGLADPLNHAAFSEAGDIQCDFGRYWAARRSYLRALRVDPNDDVAQSGLTYLEETGFRGQGELHDFRDPLNQAREHLARCQPRAALRQLEGRRSVEAMLLLCRAYGAIQDVSRTFACWKRVVRRNLRFEITGEDWFYLPDELWETTDFWRLVRQALGRLRGLNMYNWAQRPDTLAPPDLYEHSLHNAWARPKVRELGVGFHIARTSGNKQALQAFARKYPDWVEPQFVLSHMAKTGKLTTRQDMFDAYD
jgi:tetratricopeptide (TPR) repeat protein